MAENMLSAPNGCETVTESLLRCCRKSASSPSARIHLPDEPNARGFDLAMIEELRDHRQGLAESHRPGRERMALAAPDHNTAKWSADSLGRSEVEEVAEGYSYGANTIRDGVSLMPRHELRSLALPSEIMRLPNLEGYLKFSGPLPVASIRVKYVSLPAAAERFVPRGQDAGDGAAAVDDAIAVTETAPHEAPERADDGPPAQGELLLLPPPENTDDGAPAGDPAGTAPESDRASPPLRGRERSRSAAAA